MQSISSRKLRDAVDSNQRVSRFCEPLPSAVIPIRAEAASLVEGSCVPSVASDQRSSATFRSYSLFISFFYTKGTVPFVLLLQKSGTRNIAEFRLLDKERQKEYVREVMLELEAGPRQMSRVSGLSYGIIQHIKKEQGSGIMGTVV